MDPTVVSQTELKLAGDRETVSLELDPRTGEITAISGTRDAIQQISALIRDVLLKPDSQNDSDTGEERPFLPGRGKAWTDQEVRDRACPSSILSALRGERELSSADLRLTETECERDFRSVSPDDSSTRSRERELPVEVEPHGQQVSERVTIDQSPEPDRRSGGSKNAAGSFPAVDMSHPDVEERTDSAPVSMVFSTSMRDAVPPRSPGEGDLVRGFLRNAESRRLPKASETDEGRDQRDLRLPSRPPAGSLANPPIRLLPNVLLKSDEQKPCGGNEMT